MTSRRTGPAPPGIADETRCGICHRPLIKMRAAHYHVRNGSVFCHPGDGKRKALPVTKASDRRARR